MLEHNDFEMITEDELKDLLTDKDYVTSFDVHDINQVIEWEDLQRKDFNAYVAVTDHGYEYAIILNGDD